MTPEERAKRRAEIDRLTRLGHTFREIGQLFGISRERVRQICTVSPEELALILYQRHAVECACKSCGAVFSVSAKKKARKFCSPECRARHCYAEERHPDGHMWVRVGGRSTGGQRTMRKERYIAQKLFGRKLRNNEWVSLKDGNPDNLAWDNIQVRTASDVRLDKESRVHAWKYPRSKLLDVLRWQALRLGHTPAQRHLRPPFMPFYVYHLLVNEHGSADRYCLKVGLTPNSRGIPSAPLPEGFRESYAHLAKLHSWDELVATFPLQPERPGYRRWPNRSRKPDSQAAD